MNNKFAIIGGDLRMLRLAELFTYDKNEVYTYGIENIKNVKKCSSLEETLENTDIIISSIPFSKNGIDIYTPLSNIKIGIDELMPKLNNKIFFAGSINTKLYKLVDGINTKIFDLMEQEDLTILNTIATAEGTIKQIIDNTDTIIHNSNVLILGFGRVAKVLAKKLKALDAKVTCAARKDADFAWMETLGYESTNINKLSNNLNNYDIIINTVPHLIMDKEKLKYVKKDGLLIDLASKPGGFDERACNALNLKFIWALAIPGKIAPITSAKYIKNTIYNILEKEKV